MFTLDRMDIHGFKSFYGKTSFEFGRGITAVVGPNGCGKSNIGDAISWVLGDQSPRSLRADRMLDVIFNGSENRRATGMAEVTLRFMGTNGGPEPSEEFVVSRRLYRSGDSEYSLNGTKCRLKDIQDMLMRSQVGSRLYSVIEQGKVDQILTSKPKDRRGLFEEAAGILAYKLKRRIAIGKLEATQSNLLRLNDILIEVERQTNSLRRQVAKANRYQRLQEQIRDHRSILLRAQLQHWEEDMRGAESVRKDLADCDAELSANLARCDAIVESLRARTEEAEGCARSGRDRLNGLDREMDRDRMLLDRSREQLAECEEAILRWQEEGEKNRKRLEEREAKLAEGRELLRKEQQALAEIEEDLARREAWQQTRVDSAQQAEQEAENCRTALLETLDLLAEARSRCQRIEEDYKRTVELRVRMEKEISVAAEERERLLVESEEISVHVSSQETELRRVRAEKEGVERELGAERARLEHLRGERETLTGAAAQSEERIRALEASEQGVRGNGHGARLVLNGAREGKLRVRGRVVDLLEVEREWLTAAEAALGGFLEALRVAEPVEALEGVRFLKAGGKGRCGFVATSVGGTPRRSIPEDLLRDCRCEGALAGKIRFQGEDGEALRSTLEETLLVSDLEAALAFHRRHPEWSYVTAEGDLIRASGLIEGGTPEGIQKGLLSLRREREEETARLGSTRARREELEGERESAERSQRSLEAQLGRLDQRIQDREKELVRAQLQLTQRQEEAEKLTRSLEVGNEECGRLAAEREGLMEERTRLQAEVEGAEAKRRELEEKTSRLARTLSTRQEEVASGAEELGACRSRLAGERQRIASREEENNHRVQAIREERERLLKAEWEVRTGGERQQTLAKAIRDLTASLEQRRDERGGLALNLEQAEAEVSAVKTELLEAEQKEKDARKKLDEIRGRLSESEVSVARLGVEQKHLEESCSKELGLGLEELRHRPVPDGGPPLSELENEMAELRSRLERLGAVNLVALEEFQEMDRRCTFLLGQKNDLEESIQSLNDTIRKINRTSREKFLQAFEQIQGHFNQSFVTLFGGGGAELKLMPDEDVLECGIDISASPPGKRLQSISLLSGGEKALTAVALLFAIFRYRPSPFCVLDEVDAPLDEANVTRFIQMLREMTRETQFILITHNRRSMEAADLLYGITMEEPGISKAVSMRMEN